MPRLFCYTGEFTKRENAASAAKKIAHFLT